MQQKLILISIAYSSINSQAQKCTQRTWVKRFDVVKRPCPICGSTTKRKFKTQKNHYFQSVCGNDFRPVYY